MYNDEYRSKYVKKVPPEGDTLDGLCTFHDAVDETVVSSCLC